ncbi:ribulose-phosphate 3-epimerase [bacterium]|nr:ribulose-phosphate 3-epimerase [bacterium]MBU1065857.1 ribulose-phosphate 3-epimerase [bacterium]MBU1634180.1 ribulose-phosphate 3-epimerase [bacterium]MBU1872799.1 ribulose-phosphate 3-epimerase [bacterium]
MEIVPSLLSADFTKLSEEIRAVEEAGATRLHLDVMDGNFVPNITIGPFIVEAIRKQTKLHLESHLMITNPEKFIEPFIKAGSDTVVIHIESSQDVLRDFKTIRELGAKAGLVINPPTLFADIEPYLEFIDHLLVMTVNPGFGGQKMIKEALDKVVLAKPYSEKYGFPIEIDGGVNIDTVTDAKNAGTDLIVAGSAVFSNGKPFEDYRALMEKLRSE